MPPPTTAPERKGSITSLVGLLHFEDPALLRGVRLTDVLRSCGRVFTSSTGTAETYAMSSRVDLIDVFVSHNWAVGRVRKYLILLFYFNLDVAIASMAVTNMIVLPLIYKASLRKEAVEDSKGTDWGFVPVAASCTILAFGTGLLFGHRAKEVLGLHSQRLFLDKVCISQVDEDEKAQGIRNLGAFLHHSSNLLVCFTGLYLKKIWTMYEFASFLLLHQGKTRGVHIIPASFPPLIMLLTISGWAGQVFQRVIVAIAFGHSIDTLVHLATVIMAVLGSMVVVFAARMWARQQKGARAMFKGFRFDDAVCTDETDRARVRRNILQLMKHSTLNDAATDEEALLAFDDFVRTAGLHAFDASVGNLGCPYRFLLPTCLLFFSDTAGLLCFRPRRQPPAWNLALEFNSELVGAFAGLPLAVALGLRLTKCCLRLRGVCEVAYCGAILVLALATMAVAHPGLVAKPLMFAAWSAPTSPAGVGYFLHCLCVCGAAAFAYRPQRRSAYPTCSARKEGVSQSREELASAEDVPPKLDNFN